MERKEADSKATEKLAYERPISTEPQTESLLNANNLVRSDGHPNRDALRRNANKLLPETCWRSILPHSLAALSTVDEGRTLLSCG